MTSPFPQLLRRANLATYDPLITRIYTSTPSSKSQHSDWGLKFPVNAPKGPRYIKFSSLDAGPGVNCDWKSAEREARFVQAWGNGRVRWHKPDDPRPFLVKIRKVDSIYRNDGFGESDLVEDGEEGSEVWMRDVESMSEDEFERYLERIRSERSKFLEDRLQNVPESTRQTLALPEDNTLVHLATAGKTTGGATANFQASLTASDLLDPSSNKIHSRPHRVHGLSYSSPATSTNDHQPALDKKGRALNKVSRYDEAHSRSRSGGLLARSGANNLPFVVGLGGATARTNTSEQKMSEAASELEEIDYTRANPSRGVGHFRVTSAELKQPASVLGLAGSRPGSRVGGRWRSASSSPSPLDTVNYDINVELTSGSDGQDVELGSRGWVGQEPRVSLNDKFRSDLGAGGPRKSRNSEETFWKLREKQDKQDTMNRLTATLAKYRDRQNSAAARDAPTQ
ncbi:hypothetical protein IAU60_005512 [Kwoniella sp. DSM 27419]